MKCRIFMLAMVLALSVSFMTTDMVVAENVEAKSVTFVNKYHKTVSFAVRYKDRRKGWVTKGWYSIKPKSRRIFNFNSKNTVFYLYGKAADYRWYGRSASYNREYNIMENRAFEFVGNSTGRGARKARFFRKDFVRDSGVYVFKFLGR